MLGATPVASGQDQRPMTLTQAVTLALQRSSDMALARARLAVADQQAGLARAPFGPNVVVGSGAGYTHGFPMTPGGGAPALFDASYIQTIFNSPLSGEARAAAQRAEVERLGVQTTRDSVILRTAEVFLDLVQVRLALEARRGTRDAVAHIQEITDSRVVEGHELPAESIQARLAAAREEQAIVTLEGREDVLASELRDLTGAARDQSVELAPDPLELQAEQPTVQLVARALASDGTLQQAEYQQRAREDHLKGSRGGYWPTIDVVGDYALLAKFNNYDEFFRRFERNNLNVGIQARWFIVSSQTASAVRLAESELRQADVELQLRREEIEATVRRASQRTRELMAARNIAGLELQLADENLRMLRERFQLDRANLRDVERARVEDADKRVVFLQADYERQQAQLELMNATGQLGNLFPVASATR
jgi:outer membrane protein TolC